MNPVRKRLRLSPSKTTTATRTGKTQPPDPPDASYNALLSLLDPPQGEEEEGVQEDEEGYLLVEEDTTDSSLVITMEESQLDLKVGRRRGGVKRKSTEEEEETGESEEEEEEEEEEAGVEVEIDRQLDQSLETKSKQHNLTTVNVRNIIHEVITNEHVVAMMKAAINETEAIPPFEPKMTRSKFKEVVEKGVIIPAWNISPIKKTSELNKAPQFVDIPLAEEDSSDEEYHPDEEEEDETAEDTFQESDMESTASSPRGSRVRLEEDSWSPWQSSRYRSRRQRAESVSMGPPPPPQTLPPRTVTDSSFLEKLHAVEEELAVCMKPYQPLSEEEVGLMAYRTRSKRPLRDVPLGRLEAELRAPDITPDMYDSGSAHEDRDWTDWLRGLMSSDVENEEECDDEDDPEYNFLADIDEPDLEDYRDDKAVRITKKEVNELMEELFETLKEDLAGQDMDDEGHEEEEEPQDETHTLQDQKTIGMAESMAEDGPITELRTVKQQLALIQKRQKRGLLTHTLQHTHTPCPEPYTLRLDARQKARLQQQLQQHVQLLAQINLLSSPVARLHSEAETTRQFLFELDLLAQRGEVLSGFSSVFRASNLQGALQLLEELRQSPVPYRPQYHQPDALGRMRCYPVMPAELAWLFATRPVFLYPELLPCASLDPALYCPRRTSAFTAAEDCLLVLGLRNMEGSCDPTKLVSQFLLRKTLVQVRRRILQCCRPGFPDNIVKAFRYQRVVWPMSVACGRVDPADQRPPVERDENILPPWLARSLPVIYPSIKQFSSPTGSAPQPIITAKLTRSRRCHRTILRSGRKYSFPAGTSYPAHLPGNLDFQRMGFVVIQPATSSHNLPAPPSSLSPPSSPPSSPPPPSCSLSLSVAVTDQLYQPNNRSNLTPSSQSNTQPPSTPPSPKPCIQTPPTSCPNITQNSPRVVFHRLLPSAAVEEETNSAPAVMAMARERISRHYRMFASLWKMPWLPRLPLPPAGSADVEDLPGADGKENHRSSPPLSPLLSEHKSTQTGHRRRRRKDDEGQRQAAATLSPPTSSQLEAPVQEGLVVIVVKEEEEEEREREEDKELGGGKEEKKEEENKEGEEEEGEDSEVEMPLLALSESSPSAAGSVEDLSDLGEAESEEEEEVTPTQSLGPSLRRRRGRGRGREKDDDDDEGLTSSDESTLSVPELQETIEKLSWLASEGTEEEEATPVSTSTLHQDDGDDEDAQRETEDLVFAQDYLHRVCEALLAAPSRADQLVEVLDQFEAGGGGASPEDLYSRLSRVLQPWPQLVRDYAAFLNTAQAQRCGLLAEQRLFEHSRRFLRKLGRSLGQGSSHYQEVVTVLQGSSAPGPDDMRKISTLLKDHADLQEEFWEFFNQLHTQTTSVANSVSQNPPNRTRKRNSRSKSKQTREPESRTGSDGEEEEGEEEDEYPLSLDRPVCAKNIFLSSTGEKVVLWTREADRAILTACQQRGANQKTFQLVSAQLGNKTAKQVSSRFQDLMSLFRSATQKPTSCSVEDHPISSQEAAPD